ncbi:NAD(+) synthase [Mycoplasma leonicaptivi]|uniref:NAD(+) synthase n=1 Tax=Mycoplasma leonicaptivi TaxID=36742 RepID=UPI00048467A3|nr:NAD(+) synthase [Mycoplasma leonicaptivi]
MSKISIFNKKEVKYDEEIAKKYIKKVQNFLKTYLKKSNKKGFIVGISGGIDSALVYAIAKSVAPKDTYGVVMPIIEMTDNDLSDIKSLEDKFNDKFILKDLTKVFDTFVSDLDVKDKLAVANIKPRLRMTTLYALAQEKYLLVLGTDNADEVFIGYFTKFGDGGADLLPIANFTKGEVRFLAQLMQVPDSIINKKPSAGLWEGQTDEQELGFTYQDLDFYISHLDNKDLIHKELNLDVVQKIEYKHKISQHKRDKIYKPKNII